MAHQFESNRRRFLRALGAGGAAALLPQFGLVGDALAQSEGDVSDYRALVCVYLGGGNDSWNTLVPYDLTRYNTYASARGGVYNATSNPSGLALDRAQLLPITDSATAGEYGLHPNCTELQSLYNAGRVAFLPNIGTLLQPISKAQYNSTPALRPPQLFSHSDQTYQWHSGRTQTIAQGWGGLLADRVRGNNLNQSLSPCISIAGSNRYQIGTNTFPYQMSSSGLTGLSGMTGTYGAQRNAAVDLLMQQGYANPFSSEYSAIFWRSRELYTLLSGALTTGGTITTPFPANNSLADQLRMVARMIKVSRDTAYTVQHKRQIFFVSLGGFDMHDNLMSTGNSGHANIMMRVSQALNAFWNALGEITAQNRVTAFTMSDFARTLSSNGNGSDHAWGGVQLVMGGAVTGGRLYGTFPDQTLDGPVSFSRGQFIPSTSVEQMGATLARWMGVTAPADLNAIFQNLPNFATSDLGFLSA